MLFYSSNYFSAEGGTDSCSSSRLMMPLVGLAIVELLLSSLRAWVKAISKRKSNMTLIL